VVRAAPLATGLALALLARSAPALAWGDDGHVIVARAAWAQLTAAERARIATSVRAFERACLDADIRKPSQPLEPPRHYMDVENYTPRFLQLAARIHDRRELERAYALTWPVARADVAARFAAVPRSWRAYLAFRGADARLDAALGTIPYAIGDTVGRLTAAKAPAERAAAAGDLCHYVGDLVQPMHVTANFRGQLSGNVLCAGGGAGGSVHERFESVMVHVMRAAIEPRVTAAGAGPAVATAEPIAMALPYARAAYERLEPLLAADRALVPNPAACDHFDPAVYSRAMYARVGDLTVAQLTGGAQLLARLLNDALAKVPPP
jgi:hypothetical protein